MKGKILIFSTLAIIAILSAPFCNIQAKTDTFNSNSDLSSSIDSTAAISKTNAAISSLEQFTYVPEIGAIYAEAQAQMIMETTSINWCWLWDKLLDGMTIAMGVLIANDQWDELMELKDRFDFLKGLYEYFCGEYKFLGTSSVSAEALSESVSSTTANNLETTFIGSETVADSNECGCTILR
jgi:hypothetical protein